MEMWKPDGHMFCKIMSVFAVWLPNCVLLVSIKAQHMWHIRSIMPWTFPLQCSVFSLGLWEQVQLVQTTLFKAAGMVHISTLKSHSSILPNPISFTEISQGDIVASFSPFQPPLFFNLIFWWKNDREQSIKMYFTGALMDWLTGVNALSSEIDLAY